LSISARISAGSDSSGRIPGIVATQATVADS
jgi:hypothetical protein